MVNAQEWLDKEYPEEKRSEIKELDIINKDLKGELIIKDFPNLESIKCGRNDLTSIKLTILPELNYFHANSCQIDNIIIKNCPKIKELNIANNLLTDTKFLTGLNLEKLTHLSIHSNNFAKQDLSFLNQFINLEKLFIDNHDQEKLNQDIYNRFTGSLQPLQNLTNLKWINIANTDIDSGLKYLPKSLKKICLINRWERKIAGYLEIKWEMERAIRFFGVTEKLQQEEDNEPPFAKDWYRVAPWSQARELLGEEEFKKQVIQQDAQKWLDESYPPHANREHYQELIINNKNIVGNLELTGFINLQKLNCSDNQLTNLNLIACQDLLELDCSNNKLTNCNFLQTISHKEKLNELLIGQNELKGSLDFLIPFTKLTKLNVNNNNFGGSLKPLENIKELKILDISHTNIDSDLHYLADSCHELYCDANSKSKSKKLANILTKYLERNNNKEYFNLIKWQEELRNNIILSIPVERLFVIRSNIKQFINKWNKKDNELSELQSPEELAKGSLTSRRTIYATQFIGRGAAVAGAVLTFRDYSAIGSGILGIYPFSELVVSKLEENLKNGENKWKEFLTDADNLLDNYNELLGILKQIEVGIKLGKVNEAFDNLKSKVDDFLAEYDENKDEEIDINELTKSKEKRDKLAQDVNKEKKGKLWEIVNSLKELEKEIINYRRGFYYGKAEEATNATQASLGTQPETTNETIDGLRVESEQHSVIEVMPTPSNSTNK